MPKCAENLYAKSVPDTKGQNWYAIDEKGSIHIFRSGNDGTVHWSGDESQGKGLPGLPNDVEKRLRQMHKEGKGVKLGC